VYYGVYRLGGQLFYFQGSPVLSKLDPVVVN